MRGVFRRWSSTPRSKSLSHERANFLQLIIYDALHTESRGRVHCIPPISLSAPFTVTWYVQQRYATHEELQTDASGLCAKCVPPGNVQVTLVDRHGIEAHAQAMVGTMDTLPTVVRYETTAASHATARDGTVRAVVENAPSVCRYLWTTGVVTRDPVLHYVSPGTYAVVCMHYDNDHVPLPFMHHAAPVRLDAREPKISSASSADTSTMSTFHSSMKG